MTEADNEEHKIEVIKPVSITPKEYAQSTEFSILNEPLGAVVVAFSELEAQLTMAINALLNLDFRDGIALEDLMQSFAARRKLFSALAALKTTDPLKKEVEKKGGLNSRLLECNKLSKRSSAWTVDHNLRGRIIWEGSLPSGCWRTAPDPIPLQGDGGRHLEGASRDICLRSRNLHMEACLQSSRPT